MTKQSGFVPTYVMHSMLPARTNVAAPDWTNFVNRMDNIAMTDDIRRANPVSDRWASSEEGAWLSSWMKEAEGQRLTAAERAMGPFYVQACAVPTTKQISEKETWEQIQSARPACVPADAISGEIKLENNSSIALRDVAARIATTPLENLDGSVKEVPMNSLFEARAAMTPAEWHGAMEIFRQYFPPTYNLLSDSAKGVSITLKRPQDLIKWGVDYDREAFRVGYKQDQLTIKAPPGSKVAIGTSAWPGYHDDGRRYLMPEATKVYEVPASGELQVPYETAAVAQKYEHKRPNLNILITNDHDGESATFPEVLANLQVDLPSTTNFSKTGC